MSDALVERLRASVAGWKPRMTIEVRVDDLTTLLDELDRLRALERFVRPVAVEDLEREAQP